jgi:hypothetical protein
VAEDRYCKNCGQELQPDDRFCPNCGRPVHTTVHTTAPAPTPEADAPVPPPTQAEAGSQPPRTTEQATPPRESKPSAVPVLAILIPFFVALAVAIFVGPRRLGYMMGIPMGPVLLFAMILGILIGALWALSRIRGR